MRTAVFAGTFDPVTNGHLSIIKRMLKRYGKVIVVVGENKNKTPFFPLDVRLNAVRAVFCDDERVEVVAYSHLDDYKNFLLKEGATHYVRGIRNFTDYLYEKKAKKINRTEYPFIKTVFYYAVKDRGISSTSIRKLIEKGLDYSQFVPQKANKVLSDYLSQKQGKE